MQLSGLHFLLTYQCTFECDHCFVFGSPNQSGVMTLAGVRHALAQAKEMGTVRSVYFEGGEPFLYYALLLQAVTEAYRQGFEVGIVSNAFWATSPEDAAANLKPFSQQVIDLSVSNDLFHSNELNSRQVQFARDAAHELGIPTGYISVARPEDPTSCNPRGQLPEGMAGVMYRGRAAEKLSPQAALHPWEEFTGCPYEDLRDPGRIHLDPLGYLHICQGISIGNLFQNSLKHLCEQYDPDQHPIAGALLHGGPAELIWRYNLPHAEGYADACHLCFEARKRLQGRFPDVLAPSQMYGIA